MYAIPARRKTVTENDFLDAVNKIKSSTLERTNAAAPHHPDASGRDAGARLGAGGYGFSVTNSTLSPKSQMKSSRTSHFSLSRLLQAPLNRAAATAPFGLRYKSKQQPATTRFIPMLLLQGTAPNQSRTWRCILTYSVSSSKSKLYSNGQALENMIRIRKIQICMW